MPRTDVPAPGQGKRSKKKAWRDNADQSIAIYNLAAAETPESSAIEDSEATSQALPYWDDDVPQPQSHSTQQTYTIEEAQDLVEMAFQEGWQQGMEEGYKLGKDKGYKEYKEHKVQEEEGRPRKAKKQANEATDAYQDTLNTPSIVTRVNATTQMDPAAPKPAQAPKRRIPPKFQQYPSILHQTTHNHFQASLGTLRRQFQPFLAQKAPKSSKSTKLTTRQYLVVLALQYSKLRQLETWNCLRQSLGVLHRQLHPLSAHQSLKSLKSLIQLTTTPLPRRLPPRTHTYILETPATTPATPTSPISTLGLAPATTTASRKKHLL